MKTTWLLVCNAEKAIVYDITVKNSHAKVVTKFEHPEGRMKGVDLQSDGSGHYRANSAGRGKFAEHYTPHQIELMQFAEQIDTYLNEEHAKQHFDEVIICAEPQILGIIKEHLSQGLNKAVKLFMDKDYIPLPEHDLKKVIETIQHEHIS